MKALDRELEEKLMHKFYYNNNNINWGIIFGLEEGGNKQHFSMFIFINGVNTSFPDTLFLLFHHFYTSQ